MTKMSAEGGGRLRPWLTPLVTLGILLLIYSQTQAKGPTWANYGMDGGDLFAAVATMGVPHPTGYPTYVVIGRAIALTPFGDLSQQLVWLSSAGMALAAALLAALSGRIVPGRRWLGASIGLTVGLAFGLAPVPWSQAVVIEVHALNALFVALALALSLGLNPDADRPRWRAAVLGAVCGIGLGNHLTFALLLPALGALVWRWARETRDWRLAVLASTGLILGLGVYAYLPLAARADPPVNWGDPSTWAGFRWVITGELYQGLAFGLPLGEIPRRVAAWAGLLVEQFGFLGVGAGIFGLVYGGSRYTALDRLTYWMVPVYSLFALGYNTADSFGYLIPAYIGFGWWIALGLKAGADRLGGLNAGWALLLPVLLLAEIGVRLPARWIDVDASDDRQAVRFVEQLLGIAPDQAIILTEGTEDSFALWYAHFGQGARSDLKIIVAPLAQFTWYREGLRHTYPSLAFPDYYPDEVWGWADMLLARNPLPVCRTRIGDAADEARVTFTCDQ